MRKADIDLYRMAYGLALDQSPDINQMIDFSRSVEKHLALYADSLRKAMTPLQVLLTADYDKDLFGYRRIDIDENLDCFLDLEAKVMGLNESLGNFRQFLQEHQEGMKVIDKKLEEMGA